MKYPPLEHTLHLFCIMSRRVAVPKGRMELLNWMNEFLESDYTKVEQACDGVAYAQIVDCASGLKIPLQKFNFAARHEEDNARNLAVLQQEFKKLGIDHPVPVERLSKGRFQDNNEFLLWCFAFLHNCDEAPESYPAISRRQEALHRQVKGKGRGTLPPACVKTELAYGIDLGAPAPQRDSPERFFSGQQAGGQLLSEFCQVEEHLEGEGVSGGGGGGAPVEDEVTAEDLEMLELSRELGRNLKVSRAEQEAQRGGLEALAKERNSMWQQLRTVCRTFLFIVWFWPKSSIKVPKKQGSGVYRPFFGVFRVRIPSFFPFFFWWFCGHFALVFPD